MLDAFAPTNYKEEVFEASPEHMTEVVVASQMVQDHEQSQETFAILFPPAIAIYFGESSIVQTMKKQVSFFQHSAEGQKISYDGAYTTIYLSWVMFLIFWYFILHHLRTRIFPTRRELCRPQRA